MLGEALVQDMVAERISAKLQRGEPDDSRRLTVMLQQVTRDRDRILSTICYTEAGRHNYRRIKESMFSHWRRAKRSIRKTPPRRADSGHATSQPEVPVITGQDMSTSRRTDDRLTAEDPQRATQPFYGKAPGRGTSPPSTPRRAAAAPSSPQTTPGSGRGSTAAPAGASAASQSPRWLHKLARQVKHDAHSRGGATSDEDTARALQRSQAVVEVDSGVPPAAPSLPDAPHPAAGLVAALRERQAAIQDLLDEDSRVLARDQVAAAPESVGFTMSAAAPPTAQSPTGPHLDTTRRGGFQSAQSVRTAGSLQAPTPVASLVAGTDPADGSRLVTSSFDAAKARMSDLLGNLEHEVARLRDKSFGDAASTAATPERGAAGSIPSPREVGRAADYAKRVAGVGRVAHGSTDLLPVPPASPPPEQPAQPTDGAAGTDLSVAVNRSLQHPALPPAVPSRRSVTSTATVQAPTSSALTSTTHVPATPNRNPHGVFTPRSAARHNGHLEAVVKRRLSTARAEWQQEVEAELDQRDAAHREELEAELAAAKAEWESSARAQRSRELAKARTQLLREYTGKNPRQRA